MGVPKLSVSASVCEIGQREKHPVGTTPGTRPRARHPLASVGTVEEHGVIFLPCSPRERPTKTGLPGGLPAFWAFRIVRICALSCARAYRGSGVRPTHQQPGAVQATTAAPEGVRRATAAPPHAGQHEGHQAGLWALLPGLEPLPSLRENAP